MSPTRYVSETGYPDYRNELAVRRDAQATAEHLSARSWCLCYSREWSTSWRPEPVLQLIVKLNKEYSSPFPYPIEQGRAGVEVMKNDGLVENPASMRGAAFGALDTQRVQDA